jgi:hypothetical protein
MTDPLQKIKTPYVKTKVGKGINKLGRSVRPPTISERLTSAYRAIPRAFTLLVERLGVLWPWLLGALSVAIVWTVFWILYSIFGTERVAPAFVVFLK